MEAYCEGGQGPEGAAAMWMEGNGKEDFCLKKHMQVTPPGL
jgi:hypothetical protein